MKRICSAILVLALLLLCAVPVHGAETSMEINRQGSEFPADTVIKGNLTISGDCPSTVILINVTVQGTLYIQADHPVTVRLQGSSSCSRVEISSDCTIVGGSLLTVRSQAGQVSLSGAAVRTVTVEADNASFTLDGSADTVNLRGNNIAFGGADCHAEKLTIKGESCTFDGTYDTLKEFPAGPVPICLESGGVKAELALKEAVSPADSVVEATLTFTEVPEDMAGDYRIYWYIDKILSDYTWHFTVETGAQATFAVSAHFDGAPSYFTVWAELTRTDGSETKLCYAGRTQVKDYSTAAYTSLERTDYPYQIQLLRNQNVVLVYGLDKKGEYTNLVNVFVCSVGYYNPTPEGTFQIGSQLRWGGLLGDLYGQYESQFSGNMLFHSVPYRSQVPFDVEFEEYNKLGEPASSGCVRLCVADAKWIYSHCRPGTQVIVYDSETCPVVKPVPIRISEDSRLRGWDPTDPDTDNPTLALSVPPTQNSNTVFQYFPASPKPVCCFFLSLC